VTQRIVS